MAKELGGPVTRVQDILKGRRGITAETAVRLEGYFGVGARVWLRTTWRTNVNPKVHSHRTAWLNHGRFVSAFDFNAKRVTFVREP